MKLTDEQTRNYLALMIVTVFLMVVLVAIWEPGALLVLRELRTVLELIAGYYFMSRGSVN